MLATWTYKYVLTKGRHRLFGRAEPTVNLLQTYCIHTSVAISMVFFMIAFLFGSRLKEIPSTLDAYIIICRSALKLHLHPASTTILLLQVINKPSTMPATEEYTAEKLNELVATEIDRINKLDIASLPPVHNPPVSALDKTFGELIDHTILAASATWEQVKKVLDEALVYGFGAVCINPVWVEKARECELPDYELE
jgi:hypothetical protein